MIFALSSLIVGSKMSYHNRSYKALYRGLATKDFLVTPEGLSEYEAYCKLGPSVLEMMEEHRQNHDGLLGPMMLDPVVVEPLTYFADVGPEHDVVEALYPGTAYDVNNGLPAAKDSISRQGL